MMKSPFEPFYASGSRGTEVRADGRGGVMARGFYFNDELGDSYGPYETLARAKSAATPLPFYPVCFARAMRSELDNAGWAE
jgi:hypothetical protein